MFPIIGGIKLYILAGENCGNSCYAYQL